MMKKMRKVRVRKRGELGSVWTIFVDHRGDERRMAGRKRMEGFPHRQVESCRTKTVGTHLGQTKRKSCLATSS